MPSRKKEKKSKKSAYNNDYSYNYFYFFPDSSIIHISEDEDDTTYVEPTDEEENEEEAEEEEEEEYEDDEESESTQNEEDALNQCAQSLIPPAPKSIKKKAMKRILNSSMTTSTKKKKMSTPFKSTVRKGKAAQNIEKKTHTAKATRNKSEGKEEKAKKKVEYEEKEMTIVDNSNKKPITSTKECHLGNSYYCSISGVRFGDVSYFTKRFIIERKETPESKGFKTSLPLSTCLPLVDSILELLNIPCPAEGKFSIVHGSQY